MMNQRAMRGAEPQLSEPSCTTGRNREQSDTVIVPDVDGNVPAVVQQSSQNTQQALNEGTAMKAQGGDIGDKLPHSKRTQGGDHHQTRGLAVLEGSLARTHVS